MAPYLERRGMPVRTAFGRDRWSQIGIGLLLAFTLCYTTSQHALSSPNERSRLYLTVALFEQHSYAIDAVRLRFGSVLDEAIFNGHYFTDKAPGASLLALIPYAAFRLFLPAERMSIEYLLDIARYGLMVPCGILAWLSLEALCRSLRISASTARWVALVTALGTPAFHYSAAFFGHQIVATCLVTALYLLNQKSRQSAPTASPNAWFAGILIGLAGITEYQSLIGVLGVTGFCLAVSRGRRLAILLPYLLGGLPFAVWLAFYQKACFGGYFELSYHHLSDPVLASLHRRGLGGVEMPTPVGAFGMLLSLHRGLLSTSPLFATVPLGLYGLWRRGHVLWAALIAVVAGAEVWFVAASVTWEAGWGYGPRLLVPMLPLLSISIAVALERAKRLAWCWGIACSAALVAIVSFQAVTALFPEPPNEMLNPWLDVVEPLAAANLVAPNLGARWLGLSDWQSLLPLVFTVFALFVVLARTAQRACGSWRYVRWLPTMPVVWFLIVI
ncbi:MAG TPA: hypothetical protein VIV60_11690, partial [Polyangiaceae bacterium]